MTEQFVQGNDNTQQTPQSNAFVDQATGGETGSQDTRSPEYQIQVMQQRISDKDEFINTLKEENQNTREMVADLQERLQNMEKLSEVLNKGNQDGASQETTLDENVLVGRVIENLNKQKAEQTYQTNFQQVENKLIEAFGANHVNEKVREVADSNGLSYDDMVATAKKSPTAFYRLMGMDAKQVVTTPTPTHGTQAAPDLSNQTKDLAYYAKLRRENPKEWNTPEVQKEFRLLFTNKN